MGHLRTAFQSNVRNPILGRWFLHERPILGPSRNFSAKTGREFSLWDYSIETMQTLSLSNMWQNAATVLMGTSDTIWMDPMPTNVTKFYRVIGNR